MLASPGNSKILLSFFIVEDLKFSTICHWLINSFKAKMYALFDFKIFGAVFTLMVGVSLLLYMKTAL